MQKLNYEITILKHIYYFVVIIHVLIGYLF